MLIGRDDASLLLAQHEAAVTKVKPLTGDWSRALGRQYSGFSADSDVGSLPTAPIPGISCADSGDPRRHVPRIGENGKNILKTLGITPEEIDALVTKRVISVAYP